MHQLFDRQLHLLGFHVQQKQSGCCRGTKPVHSLFRHPLEQLFFTGFALFTDYMLPNTHCLLAKLPVFYWLDSKTVLWKSTDAGISGASGAIKGESVIA
jgi:hypothetical protein